MSDRKNDLLAYVVLRVAVRGDDTYAAADDRQTVERYLYGRSFYLGVAAHPVLRATWDLVFVVERRYAAAIVARLASGLYFGRIVGDVPTVDPDAYTSDSFAEPSRD